MEITKPIAKEVFESILRDLLGDDYRSAEILFEEFGPAWSDLIFCAFNLAYIQDKVLEVLAHLETYYTDYFLYNAPIDKNEQDPWTARTFHYVFTRILDRTKTS